MYSTFIVILNVETKITLLKNYNLFDFMVELQNEGKPLQGFGVYNINLDTKFHHLELIDVPSIVAACTEKWQNYTLTQVNDSVVRIGIVEGEFH